MAAKTCSPSSSSSLAKYDVFVSFRGEDTRTSFTDYLFRTLKRERVNFFRDDDLERGADIGPALRQAIRDSRFAVVVLSETYSSSSWCLEELVEIVKCKRELGLTLLPIFYYVEPTEVRNQTGLFGNAFAEASQRYAEKVNKWREALMEAATVSGWNVRNRLETEVLDEIAKVISKIINQFPSCNNDLVEMPYRIRKIDSLLEIGLDDVRTIGIWGMGGIGKTTIAQEIFNISFNKFEAYAFIQNVREEMKKKSLHHLQKLLCKDLLDREVKIQNDDMGIHILRKRLRSKRVLIILDDVDRLEQIEALVGNAEKQHECLGPGSRVIVTTRNKHLLRTYGENNVYEVDKLTNDEAVQLFCRKAFHQNHPPDDFLELCNDFVEYANGHPLALEVLGSFLFGRKKKVWSDALDKMKKNPKEDISYPLRVTYDGLDENEKKIFLDIACFFKGEDESRVKNILESCGFNPHIGIEVLIEKSLITRIGNKLWMHDLLQELGRDIVHRESLEESGKRSRLWLYDDAKRVLENNKGTQAVEGIFLSSPENEGLQLKVKRDLQMENLRLLKLRNVHISNFVGFLSNNLRLLEWHGCPLVSMPQNFRPDKLVELNMSNSRIKQLWMEPKIPLEKLILMDLSNCERLIQTLDFKSVPNLERLILEGCKSLPELHPTIGELKQLVFLNLKGCKSLKRLPQSISLKSLKVFILSGCTKLRTFPEIMEDMEHLSELYLDGTAIKKLPKSITHLSSLSMLDLRDCKELLILPNFICSLTSLRTLNISGCSQVQQLPEDIESLKQLEKLDACRTAIHEAPSSILLMKNLKTLCFASCSGVPSYKTIYRGSVSNHFHLPNSFSGLSSLTSLNLSKCNLQAIPEDIRRLSSLQGLDLSENNFISLPGGISQLSKLKLVRLNKCGKLQSLPRLPKSTQYVQAYGCPKLNDLTIIWASNNGFNFIDSRKSLKVRRAVTFHDLPLPDEFIPVIFHKFIQEIIYHGMNLEICFPYTRIPGWINDWIDESSIRIDVPLEDYNQTWMGIALFVVFQIMELDNFYEYWYSEETVCEFSIGKCCVGRFVIESLKNFGVGSYVLCIYVPKRMFAKHLKPLNYPSHIQASVLTNRQEVKVKMCGKHVVYNKDVPKFTQNLVHTSKQHQQLSSLEHYMYLLSQARRGERSLDIEKLHQSNRFPIPRYEGFTTTRLASQLRINLRSLLRKIFFKGSCYARNGPLVVQFPVQAYVSSWLFHQSLGRIVICYLPRNLFDDESWVGFCVYVGLKMHPSYLTNKNSDSETDDEFLYVDLYSHGNTVSHITSISSFPISQTSHQVVLFHVPRMHFREELNQCWGVSALSSTTIPHVEVEICGIRLICEHDLENEVQVMIDVSLSGTDDESRHQTTYQYLSELVEDLVDKVGCGEQETGKEEVSIHSGFSSRRKHKSLQENKSMLSMAQPVDKQVFTALEQFSIPRDPIILHSMNGLFDSSRKMNDSIDSMIPFAHLQIMAETPLYTDNLEMWKINLEDSLKQYCCSKFYITLSIRGHIISALKPFIPSTTFNFCFPRKETLKWFRKCHHSGTQRLEFMLPQNLTADVNWRGLAVCVAFSIDDHQTATHEIEELDISFRVLCHLNTNQGCLNPAPSFRINKDKFKWLYVGGFIWITYVPHQLLLADLNEQSSLEINIYNECPGVTTQSLDAVLLYEQDVEDFRQSIGQFMTSFFSNLDLIAQYISDETKDPSHAQDRNE